jgi:hypothetical protein
VFACAGRFALARLLEPFEVAGGPVALIKRLGWAAPAALGVALVVTSLLPIASMAATYAPEPTPELPDGSTPKLTLVVGSGPATAVWLSDGAAAALPPPGTTAPVSGSARVWILPPIPPVTIQPNVSAFSPSLDQATANQWAHDVVLDLIIESEARRSHDLQLAGSGAFGDALTEFTDVINQDVAGGKIIQKTYTFDRVQLSLFLPKFSTQARRLIGVSLHGTAILITRDASGNEISRTTQPYSKSWGLGGTNGGTYQVINADFTDLTPA